MQSMEPPRPVLRRPPPKPPLFGIRIHPVVGAIVILTLVGIGLLIALASNPRFLPEINPFGTKIELAPK